MEDDALYSQCLNHMRAGLHCAEAVALTVLEAHGHQDPLPAVRAASGFGGGIAGSTQELCGAFTGGVIALGSLLGRHEPGLELKDCARAIKEFKQGFLHQFGSLQCRPLLDAQAVENSQAPSCPQITAGAASLLGRLLQERQAQAPALAGLTLAPASAAPGHRLAPGACPFGGCGC